VNNLDDLAVEWSVAVV